MSFSTSTRPSEWNEVALEIEVRIDPVREAVVAPIALEADVVRGRTDPHQAALPLTVKSRTSLGAAEVGTAACAPAATARQASAAATSGNPGRLRARLAVVVSAILRRGEERSQGAASREVVRWSEPPNSSVANAASSMP